MGSGMTSGECSGEETVEFITEEMAEQRVYTTAHALVVTLVSLPIWCLGLLTNLSFLVVLLRVPSMKTDTNLYLGSLAVVDVAYLTASVVFYSMRYFASPLTSDYAFRGSAACVGYILARNVPFFTGLALITTVSQERYLSVCQPIRHLRVRGRRRTLRLVGMCWLTGSVLSGVLLPNDMHLGWTCVQWPNSSVYDGYPSAYSQCHPAQHWIPYYAIPLDSSPWLVALVFNAHKYAGILKSLGRRRVRSSRDQRKWETRRQVARMLTANGVVFFCCQGPYFAYNLTVWLCLLARAPNPLDEAIGAPLSQLLVRLPLFVNASVNPLIYSAVSAQYRAAFRQAFCRQGPPRSCPVLGACSPEIALSGRRHIGTPDYSSDTLTFQNDVETRL